MMLFFFCVVLWSYLEQKKSKNAGEKSKLEWWGGSRVGIKNSALEKLSLKYLLNMQVEMSSRQLDI